MGGLEEYGGEIGWKRIGRIKKGTACNGPAFSLKEVMRYEERIHLDSRLEFRSR